MAARQTIKNRINKILSDTTKGRFHDDSWVPVHATWKALKEAGYPAEVQNTRYGQDTKGNPCEKVWHFEITAEKGKPFYGVLTCHGAGTVENPLSVYDISAYVG